MVALLLICVMSLLLMLVLRVDVVVGDAYGGIDVAVMLLLMVLNMVMSVMMRIMLVMMLMKSRRMMLMLRI